MLRALGGALLVAGCSTLEPGAFDAGPVDCPDQGWAGPAGCTATDLAGQLACVPGLTAQRVDAGPAFQQFELVFTQPVDHHHPDAGTFGQRATLLFWSAQAPTVLYTTGYGLPSRASSELQRTFHTNQLSYEHRYFTPSRPVPADWSHLTIEQAAADAHRLTTALRWLTAGPWVSTGASKGGMTSLYHRRFHPCDVDATVAYVAPLTNGIADEVYPAFLASVGGATWAECRDKLTDYQRRLLSARARLVPLIGGTFSRVTRDQAFELAVVEFLFAFWQYTDPADPMHGCAAIPGADATDAELINFLTYHSPPDELIGDEALDYYRPYYDAAARQLGYPAPAEAHLEDLLRFPRSDQPATYLPLGGQEQYDWTAMASVSAWLAKAGRRVMLVYGEFDPWGARRFELGDAQDSYTYIAPQGNHGARLGVLSPADQAAALTTLTRWLGTPVVVVPRLLAVEAPPRERVRR